VQHVEDVQVHAAWMLVQTLAGEGFELYGRLGGDSRETIEIDARALGYQE
jgi:hypothetical protein